MKKIVLVGKIYMMLIGAFFILMAVDVFSMDLVFWQLIVGFLISISPGVAVIIFTWIFWKKERLLGIILLIIGGVFFVWFDLWRLEQLPTLFILTVPLVTFGIVFIIYSFKKAH